MVTTQCLGTCSAWNMSRVFLYTFIVCRIMSKSRYKQLHHIKLEYLSGCIDRLLYSQTVNSCWFTRTSVLSWRHSASCRLLRILMSHIYAQGIFIQWHNFHYSGQECSCSTVSIGSIFLLGCTYRSNYWWERKISYQVPKISAKGTVKMSWWVLIWVNVNPTFYSL